MGSRVEYILLIVFICLSVFILLPNRDNIDSKSLRVESNISSEIVDFIEYDINKSSIQYRLKSTLAQEIKGLWYLKSPIVSNDEIQSLSSRRGVANKDSKIDFIDDVKLFKRDGKKYFSQRAIYNIKTKVVNTPSNFLISKEYDMVKGSSMAYDTSKKETKAKNVKATFKMKK